MKTFELQRTQHVPRSLSDVFEFFSDAANLEILTPPWLHFRILTPTPVRVNRSTKIDYRIAWHGVPLRWTTEIVEWDPPHSFADIQLGGPYRFWRHTHKFQADGGQTRMWDTVQYALPLGALGTLAHRLAVRRDVERVFDYRAARIRALFGSTARAPIWATRVSA